MENNTNKWALRTPMTFCWPIFERVWPPKFISAISFLFTWMSFSHNHTNPICHIHSAYSLFIWSEKRISINFFLQKCNWPFHNQKNIYIPHWINKTRFHANFPISLLHIAVIESSLTHTPTNTCKGDPYDIEKWKNVGRRKRSFQRTLIIFLPLT